MRFEVKVPEELWPRRGGWSGVVVRLLKREGDAVSPGEVVAEVEIEKAVLEIESPVGGVVEEVVSGEGSRVGPGSVILVVRRGKAEAEGED